MSHQNNSSKPAASVEELLASNPALAEFVAQQAAQLAAQQLASIPRGGRPKTPCTLTAKEFCETAESFDVVVAGNVMKATPKLFASGGFGWYIGGKLTLPVNDERSAVCQVGINISVVNSKDAPRE